MTAREQLAALLESLDEEEATAYGEELVEQRAKRRKWHDPRADEWHIKPKKSPQEVAAFLREWESNGPTLTEAEWEEFARDFDRGRRRARCGRYSRCDPPSDF